MCSSQNDQIYHSAFPKYLIIVDNKCVVLFHTSSDTQGITRTYYNMLFKKVSLVTVKRKIIPSGDGCDDQSVY